MAQCRLLFLIALLCSASAGAEVLIRGLGPEPDSLDIHQAQGLAAINLLRDVREGLLTLDAGGNPVPGMASSWQVLDNGKRYRFTLRPDSGWSDGQPLQAADFVRAWRRAVDPATASPTALLIHGVRNARAIQTGQLSVEQLGIKAIDDATLEVTLEQPVPWFLHLLTHPLTYPLADGDHSRLQDGPFNGAYQLTKWTPQASLDLSANPAFWDHAGLGVKQIRYLPIEEPAAELGRYRAGELHITETIPAGRYQWLAENLPDELHVAPYLGSFFLAVNLRHGPLADQLPLRRALSLAIDRDKLTRLVLAAGEQPAWGLIPPGMGDYQSPAMEHTGISQSRREQQAQELYRAAGFSRLKPLRVQLRFNTSTTHRRMAVAVAAMWKQVLGVSSELVNEEWKVFVNNRRQGVVTEIFRGGWIADYPDAQNFLILFRSQSELNWTGYNNPEFDQLLAHADSTVDPERRLAILGQAEGLLMNEQPFIPLYYYVSRHLVKPAVSGFVDNSQDVHLSRYIRLDGVTRP